MIFSSPEQVLHRIKQYRHEMPERLTLPYLVIGVEYKILTWNIAFVARFLGIMAVHKEGKTTHVYCFDNGVAADESLLISAFELSKGWDEV